MSILTPNETLTAPLLELETHLFSAQSAIEAWFSEQWRAHRVPFYGSVDLRNSGFKLASVDMNLFPGGFNNLDEGALPVAVTAARAALEKVGALNGNVLLIPENHTRNLFYLRNVAALKRILEAAGATVRVGSLLPLDSPLSVDLEHEQLVLEPVVRRENRLGLAGFDADFILLNNDLSSGVPESLQGISQPLLPTLSSGWTTRRKTTHFAVYESVISEFAARFELDAWTMNPYFAGCHSLDFHARQGEDVLAETVAQVLEKIEKKYKEYSINAEPFVIVKADAGTYGMGVMTAKSPDDVRALNRKQRNRMSVIKEGLAVSEVIVQEGVYTFEMLGEGAAEPVIYMMDEAVIGAFYRVNASRGTDENLNAAGMYFAPMKFNSTLGDSSACALRHYAYSVVARLALLAGAREIAQTAVV